MTLGCLFPKTGSSSSMTGSGLSVSMYSISASRAFCLAAGLVDGRPFSAMVAMVIFRVLDMEISILIARCSPVRSLLPRAALLAGYVEEGA